MMRLDPARTPARPDLAAAHLVGMVPAARYADAALYQVSASVAPLRARPAPDAMQETQLLFGETFAVYEEKDGWAWGQAGLDGYVGYAEMDAFSSPVIAPTHRVAALRTYVYSEPDLKSAAIRLIALNARVTVEANDGKYVRIARGGWVTAADLTPIGESRGDWVAIAERFLHTPYFWGGRESLGLDCSALIQGAMLAAGRPCPRDSRMQELEVGAPLAADAVLQRGDLVFWPGHVGVMLDDTRFLHANAFHMRTAIEPLTDTIARIGAPRTRRRS